MGFGVIAATAVAQDVTVFAAASMRDVLTDVAAQYEAATGDKAVLVFAASPTVARQIAAGAPADVVLVADQEWADWLMEQGAVAEMRPVASNQLAMIGVDTNVISTADLPAALADVRLAMAEVRTVPAGRYGQAALMSLGLWEDLKGDVVQANNVRAALRFVERGEVEYGIGYVSDLKALPNLSLAYAFDSETHPPIVYSAGSVTAKGTAFMELLASGEGRQIFVNWGFLELADP